MRYPASFVIAISTSLALAACGGQPRIAGLPGSPSRPKGPVSDWPVKVGNPYQVLGQWYYPKDDASYDQTGIASWYGPKFHGLNTANGEPYDMEMISAAHKTLPLPSYVEVTNLDNGRKIVVRVNDRGPFVGDRIIDLSRKSAELLDVERPGTARVRVRRVYPSEEVRTALRTAGGKPGQVQLASVAEIRGPSPAPAARPQAIDTMTSPVADAVRAVDLPASAAPPASSVSAAPAPSAAVPSFATPVASYIQVAAVSDSGRASWLAGFLKAYGTPVVQPTPSGLIRVRIGPYASVEDAQAALAKVRDAGYQEARIVADGPTG